MRYSEKPVQVATMSSYTEDRLLSFECPIIVDTISFKSIDLVLSSWERARQKYSNEETLGMNFLFELFKADPETKRYFGFRIDQDVSRNPMLRMGVLIHAQNIVNCWNGVMALLGPDVDDLHGILIEMGIAFAKVNVTSDVFPQALAIIRSMLSKCLGDEWNVHVDTAWTEVLTTLSKTIFHSR